MTTAIIGTGWGARIQVPAFAAAGLPVTALVGSDAAKTERAAASLHIPRALADWRALLDMPDIVLVSIVTPPDLHAEMAVALLEAGKHVLCEKPTALNLAEAERMQAAAAARPGQMALIDHELRFLPSLQAARRLLVDGAIGQVRYAAARMAGSSRADLSRPWNWWSDHARGGGLLGAVGSHHIDVLRYLLGEEPESVSALLHGFVQTRTAPDGSAQPVTSDDYYDLRLRFPGGTVAALEGIYVARIDEPETFTLYGTEGTLRWTNGQLLLAAPNQPFEDRTPPHTIELPAALNVSTFAQGTVYLAQALRTALDGENAALAPAATFEDGARIQAVIDAAHQSHRQGGATVRVA